MCVGPRLLDSLLQGQEPSWRYVDMHDSIQGPFPAANMRSWYSHNRLTHDLLVCATVRCELLSDMISLLAP